MRKLVTMSPYRSLALFGAAALSLSAAAKMPNIVLVMTDDQGYGDVSAHGNDVLKTPNLDVLHNESVRLTDFHVNPTCAPTRSALLTGRTNLRGGVWHTINGRSLLDLKEQTLPEILQGAGYNTGMFGKWHLGDNYPYRPMDRGFEKTVVHGGGGIGQGPDFWNNDYFDDTFLVDGEFQEFKGYCTDVFFNEASDFIKGRDDRPFFAYIPTNAPHGPFFCPQRWKQPYLDQGHGDTRASFYGMIANIDDNVGRLRQLLEDEGIAKDTIFIFMTDNGSTGAPGGHSFNAGMRAKKGSHYDGGHRVPFFMHWPGGGFDKNQPIDRLTAHLDVLPTLTSLIGLDHKSELPLDGQDISWMFRGEDRPYSRTLFIDTQRILQPRKWRNSCVATEKWRLINGEELYAIKDDPGQQENVAADHPEVVSELRRRYEAYWKSLQPQFTFIPWIPIGAKQSPNQRLMSHDWFLDGNPAAWHQNNARNRSVASGSWHVDVRQNGIYELKLMQVPEEAGEPMRNVVRSELWIGADRFSLPVTQGALSVVYNVRLSKGRKKLQGWLLGNDGKNRGPYYLDIKLIKAD